MKEYRPPEVKTRLARRELGEDASMTGDAERLLAILRQPGGKAVFGPRQQIGTVASDERAPESCLRDTIRELLHLDLIEASWPGAVSVYRAKETE